MRLTEAEIIKQAPRDGMSREQLLDAQKARSKKFGVEVLDGAALTFPAGFPTDLRFYGDPVNLKFPCETPGRAANARTRFKQFADGYKQNKSKRTVHTRIVDAELKFEIDPEIDPEDALDKLLPANIREKAEARMKADEERLYGNVKDVSKGSHDLTAFVPIAKVDEEERLVTGIVLEPDEIDVQNDTITIESIKEAAHRFLRRFNSGTKLGLMHKMFGDIGIELVESFIAPFDFDLNGEPVKKGSWLITVHIVCDKVWNDIKSGKLTGFSIGGVATVEQH